MAAWWLMRAQMLLALYPFRRVHERLLKSAAMTHLDPIAPACLQRMGWALRAVARGLPWPCTCLRQAVAGYLWLQYKHQPAILTIGVRRDSQGDLPGHAWLDSGGVRIVGGEAGDFTPLLTIPDTQAKESAPWA